MNKQLKIWRDDFRKFWNRTSLIMRIVIGAAASLILAYAITSYINRPLSKKIKETKKKLNNIAGADTAMMQMEELRIRKNEMGVELQNWQDNYHNALSCESALKESESGKVIIDIRKLLNDCNIKLLEEERLKKIVPVTSKRRISRLKNIKAKPNTRMKLNLPDYLDSIDYRFKAVGQFGEIKKFITELNTIEHVFMANNIVISESETLVYNHKLQPRHGVELEFEVHIPYLYENRQTIKK